MFLTLAPALIYYDEKKILFGLLHGLDCNNVKGDRDDVLGQIMHDKTLDIKGERERWGNGGPTFLFCSAQWMVVGEKTLEEVPLIPPCPRRGSKIIKW